MVKPITKLTLLGQLLLKRNLITNEQLEDALSIQKNEGGLLGEILIKQGYISEESLYITFAEQCGLTFIPVERYNISKNLLKLVPRDFLLKHTFLPVELINNVISLAISNPYDEDSLSQIQKCISYKIVWVIGTKTQIEKIINTKYPV